MQKIVGVTRAITVKHWVLGYFAWMVELLVHSLFGATSLATVSIGDL